MRRLIWKCCGWLGWALCESAFLADCVGPFAWLNRLGGLAYSAECDLGQRGGFLIENPRFGHGADEPFLIEP